MEKILITGAFGMLGCTLSSVLEGNWFNIKRHSFSKRSQYHADLTILQETFDLLYQTQPTTVINLVGLTNVDECETNPNKAYLLNTKVVENIVSWLSTAECDCHLIHISTDQIYDGLGAHSEDQVQINNIYGISKYAGELAALQVPCTVIRTNFFGKSVAENRISFTDWIYSSLINEENINVFEDVRFNALCMSTLCQFIVDIIIKKPIGIFNLGANTGLSKADFAFKFAREIGLPRKLIDRISVDTIKSLKAHRPKNMVMNCTKIINALSFTLPEIEDEIYKSAREYV